MVLGITPNTKFVYSLRLAFGPVFFAFYKSWCLSKLCKLLKGTGRNQFSMFLQMSFTGCGKCSARSIFRKNIANFVEFFW